MVTAIQLPFPGLATPNGRWISPEHADHVAAFATFLETARDIADDAALSADERIGRLKALEAELDGGNGGSPSGALRNACAQTGASLDHARHVLQACHKDVSTDRYRSWSELLTYCRYAAAPAGRFVFELHGEDERAMACADSLFSAWQVLHIVQGCKADFAARGRVYLPAMWMRQAQVEPEDFTRNRASAPLRKVIAQSLEGVQRLIETAWGQLPNIGHQNLRAGAGTSLALADRMARKLDRRDPLAGDVALGGWDRLVVKVRGRRR